MAPTYVSTGSLPAREVVRRTLDEAFERCRSIDEGEVSTIYPALARARRDAFAMAICAVDGSEHEVGDCTERFTLMSVSKPFVLALTCDRVGVDETRDLVGANATGRAFNSLDAVLESPDGRTNPMVNAGAIATTALAGGWDPILDTLSRFAGEPVDIDPEVLESARATNHVNRSLATALHERGALRGDPAEAVDLYTRQCSIAVTVRQLARMGATIAAGGRQPVTGVQVTSARTSRHVLAAMATAGMYERSGDWLWDVGLPGKSGISGCIVTIAPGKGALATWSPPLDAAGNSVRGVHAAEQLAVELGMDVFAVGESKR